VTRPPTWGSTARLAAWGLAAVLAASAALLLALVDLARGPELDAGTRLEALRTLALLGPSIVGALALVATGGTVAHGARHIGGPPAPTSAEIGPGA
jgi:hypothetical protein